MAEKTIPQKADRTKDLSAREPDRYLAPAVDIYETQDGLTVICDLPGISNEDIDVRVNENILTIKGKTVYKPRGDSIFSEFELFNYYRQFQIADDLDKEKINANMKHGVLTIQFPKVEKAKPKKIPVSVA